MNDGDDDCWRLLGWCRRLWGRVIRVARLCEEGGDLCLFCLVLHALIDLCRRCHDSVHLALEYQAPLHEDQRKLLKICASCCFIPSVLSCSSTLSYFPLLASKQINIFARKKKKARTHSPSCFLPWFILYFFLSYNLPIEPTFLKTEINLLLTLKGFNNIL